MTKCEFFIDENSLQDSENRRITGFHISGHSGFGECGSDIVCAAVSTAVIMAEAIINDVCHANAKVRQKSDADISLTLPATCDEEETIQAVLNGMLLTLLSIQEEHPDYIEVLEV